MKRRLMVLSLLAVAVCGGCASPVDPASPNGYAGTGKVDGNGGM